MMLHYRVLGKGAPLVILHGLFGSSDNWQSQAKKLAEFYTVYSVDLRNHGHSFWSPAHTYDLMAEDVHNLIEDLNLKKIILLGHSMGAKVAMTLAQQHPSLLEKLILVDMGIKEYPMHHQHILAGIHGLNLAAYKSRSEAEIDLEKHVENQGVRQFLLKNLYWKSKGELAWRMNVNVLEKNMGEILRPLPNQVVLTNSLFIRGELSNYILDEDIPEIENVFPDSEFETILGAGHWVHAEAHEEFIQLVLGFCLR
jgi:pimeloyl-ACP methyl ester carboxylesterase